MDRQSKSFLRRRGRAFLHEVGVTGGALLDSVFCYAGRGVSRYLAWTWIAALYFGGLLLWYYFFNGGSIQLELHDWAQVTAPRYAFLKDAAMGWRLPLHMPSSSALMNVTDRFVSVVDASLSPQFLLLRFLDIGRFVVVNSALLYSLGFLGMLGLRKRYRLSPVAFSFMFLLMSLNGHIAVHLAVGHANWAAVFLMPALALQVLDGLGGNGSWRWTLVTAFLLFFVFLQGAFHTFVHSLLFLGILALTDRRLLKPMSKAILFSLMLSMVRILPPLLEASHFDTEFLTGFVSVRDLLSALVDLRLPVPSQSLGSSPLSPLGWWEFDYYIGVVGLGFVAYFAAAPRIWRLPVAPLFPQLWPPICSLGLLSVGKIYKVFHILGVPLLSSQRVSSRLLIIPLSMLIVLAVLRFQRALDADRLPVTAKLAVLGALVLMAQDLWTHFKLWRVVNMGLLFTPVPLDLGRYTVANHPDPPYFAALAAGLLVSIATLMFLLVKAWREGRVSAERPRQA